MEIILLERDLSIVEASGKFLRILGTVKLYLETEVLGVRKLMEAAVIEGQGFKKILVSLGLMKKWDLIHQLFPNETVSDFVFKLNNKSRLAYSSRYSFQSNLSTESTPLKKPSKLCRKLKEDIVKEWGDCLKEKLGPEDRMNVPPVKLKMKDNNVKPSFCTRPFDTPYHLHEMYETELNACLEAGQIVPCGTEQSQWASKAFPVPKGD